MSEYRRGLARSTRVRWPVIALLVPAAARAECPKVAGDLTGDARALATLWHTRHPCAEPPPCAGEDPVATLVADLDPTPGKERVIADARFGAAMYAHDGTLLATVEPTACRAPRLEALALLATPHRQLAITTSTSDGTEGRTTVTGYTRRGAALAPIIAITVEAYQTGHDGWTSHATLTAKGTGEIVVDSVRESKGWGDDDHRPQHYRQMWKAGPDGTFVAR